MKKASFPWKNSDKICLCSHWAAEEILPPFCVYTRRVAARHLRLAGTLPYDILQKIFMDALPGDVTIYNEYHALIVALCKESCHKSGCGEICEKLFDTAALL